MLYLRIKVLNISDRALDIDTEVNTKKQQTVSCLNAFFRTEA